MCTTSIVATFHVYVVPAFPDIMEREMMVDALVVSTTAVAVVAEFRTFVVDPTLLRNVI